MKERNLDPPPEPRFSAESQEALYDLAFSADELGGELKFFSRDLADQAHALSKAIKKFAGPLPREYEKE